MRQMKPPPGGPRKRRLPPGVRNAQRSNARRNWPLRRQLLKRRLPSRCRPARRGRAKRQRTPGAIEGIWYADVSYSWGIRETEQFDFTVDGEHLRGTASFGGAPRRIVSGKLSKGRLYFVTNIESTDGAATYQYRAQISDAQIKFTLDNEGTPPTKFVAARSIEEAHRAAPRLSTGGKDPHLSGFETGPYEIAYIRTKVDQVYADVKECYVSAEFDPVDHVYTYYFVKIARDGTVTETGAPGTDQRSVELDRCMDRVFRRVNWGPPPSGSDTQIKLGFKALPDWRVQ